MKTRTLKDKEAQALKDMLDSGDPRMTKRHKHGAGLLLGEYNTKKRNRKANKAARKARKRNRK